MISVADLIDRLGPGHMALGPTSTDVRSPGTLVDVPVSGFAFCRWTGDAGRAAVLGSPASVIIVPAEADDTWRRADQSLICCAKPRRSFILSLPLVIEPSRPAPGIHPTAVIDPSATIDPSASVGAYCTIGATSVVAADVVIHPHVTVGSDVAIGRGTTIFSGSVIGADGFGYERDDDGSILKFLHIGGVRIGSNVEIGANTCVDRGTLGYTVIDDEARVDNLVHVAHNVHIGKRAFVIALTMIGGSTVIEDDAWVAPGAVLRNGIVIGSRATVGLGAVVTRTVEPDTVVLGNPAKPKETRK